MRSKKHELTSGFTLIELLTTVAIIAILTGMIIGVANLARRKSSDAKVRSDLQQIANSLEEYRMEYGEYPPNLGELQKPDTAIQPQYKDFSIIDRWFNPFLYSNITPYVYSLKSYGPDGVPSGDDIDVESKAY